MSRFKQRKGQKRTRKFAFGVGAALCAALLAVTVAVAAPGGSSGSSSSSSSNATTGSTTPVSSVTPANTTVNFFDYWVDTETGLTNINSGNDYDSKGINSGHSLKFNYGKGSGINKWTGSAATASFVSNTLVDGYPQIAKGTYTVNGTSGTVSSNESLAYLFNDSDVDSTGEAGATVSGKRAYTNVSGLFQKDSNGYYTYDCTKNYALFVADDANTSGAFNVYNIPGVNGNFFPLTGSNGTATTSSSANVSTMLSNVFNISGTSMTAKSLNGENTSSINHHMGLSMDTTFSQPVNGKVSSSQDMTYSFSGDDDVWVYIDGVLVGDLGGIHSAATLDINFATGKVVINSGKTSGSTSLETSTTLYDLYKAAGKTSVTSWNGSTYADNTPHELKFFYLERGAGASDMKLSFNLETQVASDVMKYDDVGKALPGATFELYTADENWSDSKGTEGASPIAYGTTDSDGKLTLKKASDGSILSFDTEYNNNKTAYYNLYETSVPDGYQINTYKEKCGHLKYVASSRDGEVTGGVITAPEVEVDGTNYAQAWLTGGMLSAKETITAEEDSYYYATNTGAIDTKKGTFKIDEGATFAVVLRHDSGTDNSEANWHPVYGTPTSGYTIESGSGVSAAIKAAQNSDNNLAQVFEKGTTGFYGVSLTDLPGDISKYVFMMDSAAVAKGEADYTVEVYHTTASSLAGATESNTYPVYNGASTVVSSANVMQRQFATSVNVTNIKNRIWVGKTNSDGNAVLGAKFSLYKADDITVAADGTYKVKAGKTAYDSLTVSGKDAVYDTEGFACFPDNGEKQAVLEKGTYYLVETEAPSGYEVNNIATKVIVDAMGVYADAGAKDDGVHTVVSAGSLITSMAQYGLSSGIDHTLTNVTGTLQKGTYSGDPTTIVSGISWGAVDTSAGSLALTLNRPTTDADTAAAIANYPALWYVAFDSTTGKEVDSFLWNDEGIARMKVTQDYATTTAEIAGTTKSATKLGDLELNQLTSDTTAVVYTDHHSAVKADGPVAGQVTLDGRNWTDTDEFTFSLTPADDATKTAVSQKVVSGIVDTATATKPDSGSVADFSFANDSSDGKLGFNEAGEYKFNVTQTTVGADGVTVDTHVSTVTYKVELGTDGALKVTSVAYDNSAATTDSDKAVEGKAAFTNSVPAKTASVTGADGKLTDIEGNLVGVGSQITYTINWVNNAYETVDGQKVAQAATVTVTDELPEGVTYVSSDNSGTLGTDGKTVTWTLADQAANASGQVTVTVTVNDKAIETIENNATINVKDNSSYNSTYNTTPSKVNVPKKTVSGVDANGKTKVGDELTYTVSFKLDEPAEAITVTDTVPTGTSYVAESAKCETEGADATIKSESGTISWSFDKLQAGTYTVSFKAKVTADAVSQTDGVQNQAEVQVGANGSKLKSNKVTTPLATGDMDVKLVTNPTDTGDTFDVTVKLTDSDGNPISGKFGEGDSAVTFTDGELVIKDMGNGDTKTLSGLPAGATYTVTQTDVDGYTTTYTVNDSAVSTATGKIDSTTAQHVVITDTLGKVATVERNGSLVNADGQLIGAGDVVTYEINWVNNATDDDGNLTKATVTVTDAIPAGTELVENSISDKGTNTDGTITWNLGEQAAGASGTVSFKVKVTDAAVEGAVDNQASITIGNNPAVDTNKTESKMPKKTVARLAAGSTTPGEAVTSGSKAAVGDTLVYNVSFTVPSDCDSLTVSDVVPTGTAYVAGSADNDGSFDQATGIVTWNLGKQTAGSTVNVSFKVTILASALTDTSSTVENTAKVKIGADGPEVSSNKVPTDIAEPVTPDAKDTPTVTKMMTGADATEAFTFTMKAADDVTAAALESGAITGTDMAKGTDDVWSVSKSTSATSFIKKNGTEDVSFNNPTFKAPGVYKFNITEVKGSVVGVTYDDHTYTVTYTVAATTDATKLTVTVATSAEDGGSQFTNAYSTSGSYGSLGGMRIVKTLTGRDLEADQFEFTIEGNDDASTKKLTDSKLDSTIKVKNAALDDEGKSQVAVLSGLTFDTSDEGKTYTYKISETNAAGDGYTNDSTYWTAAISVHVASDGSLYSVTAVKHYDASTKEITEDAAEYSTEKDKVTALVNFANSYKGTGTLDGGESGKGPISVNKTLTGADMTAGEFKFDLSLLSNATDGAAISVQTDATNAEAKAGEQGAVKFDAIKYVVSDASAQTVDGALDLRWAVNNGYATKTKNTDGKTVYTLKYQVSEDTVGMPDGVITDSGTTATVTVNVVDNGDGKLSPSVDYGAGNSSVEFKNTKLTGKTASVTRDGQATTADGQLVSVGEQITYTINWVNNAYITGTDGQKTAVAATVTVTDVLPAGLEFVSASEGGTNSDGTVTWSIKADAGAHGSVTVTAEVTEAALTAGKVENTAEIKVNDNPSYKTDPNKVIVPAKTASGTSTDGSAKVGDELTYAVKFEVPADATEATVTDKVPTGTEYVDGSASEGGSLSNGTVTWKLTGLTPGSAVTVSFKAKITSAAVTTNQVENTASVAVGPNGPSVNTNPVTTKVPTGDLTVKVENNGGNADDTFDVTVKITDPEGNPVSGTFGGHEFNNDGETTFTKKGGDTETLNDLPGGLTYTVTQTGKDGYTTTYTVNGDPADPAKGTVDPESPATVVITNTYGKTASVERGGQTVSVNGQTVGAGETVTYNVNWVNNATATVDGVKAPVAANVTVTDVLPDGVDFVEAAGAEYDETTRTLTWDLGEKKAGETGTVTVKVKVSETDLNGDSISNTAKVKLVNDKAGVSTEVPTNPSVIYVPKKSVSGTADDGSAKVGDELTYSIKFKAGADGAATVTDVLPTGTEFVSATNNGSYNKDTNTVTWNLSNLSTADTTTVSVTVKVTEAAVAYGNDGVSNQATIVVGKDGPAVKTNKINFNAKSGSLSIAKTVTATEAVPAPADKEFTFTVALTDSKGTALTGNYKYSGTTDGATTCEGYIANGETIKLKANGSVTVADLPEGAKFTVTEASEAGFTTTYKVDGVAAETATGSIAANATSALVVDNSYSATPATVKGSTDLKFAKILAGRDWTSDDKFTFTIKAVTDGAPMPEKTAVEVTSEIAKSNDKVEFSFGDIELTAPGTYEYTVTETGNTATDVLSDQVPAKVTVVVTDDGKGVLSAKTTIENATFDNVAVVKTATFADKADSDEEATDVKVGDVLQYAIPWSNTTDAEAVIVVTDTLAEGLTLDETTLDSSASYDKASHTITWTIKADKTESGTVGFRATVNSAAVKTIETDGTASLANTAKVSVEDNPNVTATSKPFTSTVKTGEVDVSVVNKGGDPAKEFTVTVTVTDKGGNPVTGTFGGTTYDIDGKTTFTMKNGDDPTKLTGLPEGATVTVTQTDEDGYTTTYTVNGGESTSDPAKATVDPKTPQKVVITNTYDDSISKEVSTDDLFTKTLNGRDWTEADTVSFKITAETEGAPLPESTTVSVDGHAKSAKNGEAVKFGFGTIKYSYKDLDGVEYKDGKRTKDFVYNVFEIPGSTAGVSYDEHTAQLKVTVTDNGDGTMSAIAAVVTTTDAAFTNTFRSTVDYSANGGVEVSKTVNGHAMTDGQFAYTVTADDKAAKKLGLDTDKHAYKVTAADDGNSSVIDLFNGKDVVFGPEDEGTYTFTIDETTAPEGSCYKHDSEQRTVTIEVAVDKSTGEVTVTTTAKKGEEVVATSSVKSTDKPGSSAKITVPFESTYEAKGQIGGDGAEVNLEATKTLTGRDMVAGEFSFVVNDVNGNQIATGTNAAASAGSAATVTFDKIEYSIESLKAAVEAGTATKVVDPTTSNATFTMQYTVAEDTDGLADKGVTGTATSFAITVTVADNGDGTLTPSVAYPKDTTALAFVNSYSSESAPVSFAGTKVLSKEESLTRELKDGEFEFTIKATDEKGDPVEDKHLSELDSTTAKNDASHNVKFGEVTYTQDDLAGVAADDNGTRTKTFYYEVSETIPEHADTSVTYDTTHKFTVVLTDDGKGHLTAVPVAEEGTVQGSDFCFTNTYRVTPKDSSITDDPAEGQLAIKVAKTLNGRDMIADEFHFELIDEDGNPVASGSNDADGVVTFTYQRYEKAGTHNYTLREVVPAEDDQLGGITYDDTTYKVTTTVTDNEDGTLAVTHVLYDAKGNVIADKDGKTATASFENSYEPVSTTAKLGAAKVLSGATLAKDQFTFTVTDEDGKVAAQAKNDASGQISFPELTFTADDMVDADGERVMTKTFTYKVAETNDAQANVTYDGTVYTANVTVTDDGKGQLSAQVSYEGDKTPVFNNIYNDSSKGGSNGNSNATTAVKTGDGVLQGLLTLIGAAMAAAAGTVAMNVRRKRNSMGK